MRLSWEVCLRQGDGAHSSMCVFYRHHSVGRHPRRVRGEMKHQGPHRATGWGLKHRMCDMVSPIGNSGVRWQQYKCVCHPLSGGIGTTSFLHCSL